MADKGAFGPTIFQGSGHGLTPLCLLDAILLQDLLRMASPSTIASASIVLRILQDLPPRLGLEGNVVLDMLNLPSFSQRWLATGPNCGSKNPPSWAHHTSWHRP